MPSIDSKVVPEGHYSVESTVFDTYRPAVVDRLYTAMVSERKSFWTEVYKPYMGRDITNAEVKEIIRRGLEQSRGQYKPLIDYFNMPKTDYKKFLNFLSKHGCELDCMPFRQVRGDVMQTEENMPVG